MPSLAKSRAGVVTALKAYLSDQNVDIRPLLAGVGLDPTCADDPNRLLDLGQVMELYAAAAEATGDPDFGIKFGLAMPPGASGLAGALMVNAPTVGDAIASLVAMTNAHTPNVRATFEVKGDRAELSWINPAGIIAPRQHFAAFAVTAIFNRLRQSAGEPWLSVIEAHFEFCKPADTRLLRGVFGQSLLFDQPGNGFAIDAASLSRPLQTANPALFAIATDLATRWMMDASAPDIVLAVRQEIAARLTTGTATLETVAASLDLTTSQLQWRLEQAGTTFERLTGRMRQDMAAHLLRNTDKPMMDIAFELGFSDQSTFTRAARRWFNVPPAEYRRRVRRMRRGEPPE